MLIKRYRTKAPPEPIKVTKPAAPKAAEPAVAAPAPFMPVTDGGANSWQFNPATNTITYVRAGGTLTDNKDFIYDATAVLQGTAGNNAAKAWAKSNAATITELANQQAAFDAQQETE